MGTAVTLIIIGLALIVLNLRAIKKEKNSFQGMLNTAETDMKDIEVEIGKLRKEFAETLLEVQTQVVSLEKSIENNKGIYNNKNIGHDESDKKVELDIIHKKNYKDIVDYNDNIVDVVDIDFSKINNMNKEISDDEVSDDKEEKNNNVKINEIEKLIDEGFSTEEIADKLKIGKGEILLIKELYLK